MSGVLEDVDKGEAGDGAEGVCDVSDTETNHEEDYECEWNVQEE